MSRRKCCTTGGCPFAYSEESEIAQNYGCLPNRSDIISMRLNHNKTWACHSHPDKPCLGAQLRLKELGLDYKVVDPVLITEQDDWSIYSDRSKEFYNKLSELDRNTFKNKIKENNDKQ